MPLITYNEPITTTTITGDEPLLIETFKQNKKLRHKISMLLHGYSRIHSVQAVPYCLFPIINQYMECRYIIDIQNTTSCEKLKKLCKLIRNTPQFGITNEFKLLSKTLDPHAQIIYATQERFWILQHIMSDKMHSKRRIFITYRHIYNGFERQYVNWNDDHLRCMNMHTAAIIREYYPSFEYKVNQNGSVIALSDDPKQHYQRRMIILEQICNTRNNCNINGNQIDSLNVSIEFNPPHYRQRMKKIKNLYYIGMIYELQSTFMAPYYERCQFVWTEQTIAKYKSKSVTFRENDCNFDCDSGLRKFIIRVSKCSRKYGYYVQTQENNYELRIDAITMEDQLIRNIIKPYVLCKNLKYMIYAEIEYQVSYTSSKQCVTIRRD